MVPEHYLLLILAILPILNKFSFWLYVVQLKEYRWDRFSEYLQTCQGKSAIFTFWTAIEIPLFFLSFVCFMNKPFEMIMYPVLFAFLLMQNLFVIRKIVTWYIIHPKLTGRLLLTTILILLGFSSFLYLIITFDLNLLIYPFILFTLFFTPGIIFFVNILTLPIVNKVKKKKIQKAINKSIRNKKTIKIGITGSYGKSSVKENLASILEQNGKTLYSPANINTELGVAEIIVSKLDKTYKYFVAEMGAYKIGEVRTLGKIVDHKYGFLTAIGNQHLGLFGSQFNIQKGKSEIAESVLKNKGKLYINWNDKFVRKTEFDSKLDIVKYGSFRGANAVFSILHTRDGITEFTFTYGRKKGTFETKLLGKHNVVNLTGVIAFCYDVGLTTTQIKKYLKNLKAPKNTLALIETEKQTLIDDTYNLSEDGLYAGLDAINSFKGTKILVIDDILELGRDADEIHAIIGKFLASKSNIDKILFCGVNYKNSFFKGLHEGGFDMRNILKSLDNIEENSIILFEGRCSKKYLNKLV